MSKLFKIAAFIIIALVMSYAVFVYRVVTETGFTGNEQPKEPLVHGRDRSRVRSDMEERP